MTRTESAASSAVSSPRRRAGGGARGPARADLEEFFHPKAVAIVGSVNRTADPDQLRRSYSERWGDSWYLVNARGGSVGDIPVYEHVTDIPAEVTLAVVNVGTRLVAKVVEECGEHGVGYVLIFTAGFSEVGEKGAALEREVGRIAKHHGMRVLGPNTNTNAFEVLPDPPTVRGGRIGLITQSGHQGRPLVQGAEFGVAFSRWVPTGNELDLEAADFIEYFATDADTSVIAGYFEGFRRPAKLRSALEAANSARKPVVALKMGATEAGSRVSISHTGHLAGSDDVVDGLFGQYGVVRVRDLDELLETAALFAKLPAGTGARCGLYSISGGSGALMAEVAESHGVPVPILSPVTRRALRELIPEYLTVSNPVDNGAQFLLSAPAEHRRKVFDLIAADPLVDVMVVGITGALGRLTDRFAEDIVSFVDDLAKPLVVTWNSFKTDEKGFRLLVEAGVPMFRSFRGCFGALAAFAGYERASRSFRARRPLPRRIPPEAAAVLAEAPAGTLDSLSSRRLLEAFGVSLPAERLARSAAQAAAAAREIGFPVVMKVASARFSHRSDTGLVALGVSSANEARAVYDDLVSAARRASPDTCIEGIQVQQQVGAVAKASGTGPAGTGPAGTEMIVGMTGDAVFGPAVLVGTGGVFAELFADTAVRPLPIDRRDVEEMVRSLRGYPLMGEARGRKKGDVGSLVDLVMAVARLASACGERITELDLNPVIVLPRGSVAVDRLVVVR